MTRPKEKDKCEDLGHVAETETTLWGSHVGLESKGTLSVDLSATDASILSFILWEESILWATKVRM